MNNALVSGGAAVYSSVLNSNVQSETAQRDEVIALLRESKLPSLILPTLTPASTTADRRVLFSTPQVDSVLDLTSLVSTAELDALRSMYGGEVTVRVLQTLRKAYESRSTESSHPHICPHTHAHIHMHTYRYTYMCTR